MKKSYLFAGVAFCVASILPLSAQQAPSVIPSITIDAPGLGVYELPVDMTGWEFETDGKKWKLKAPNDDEAISWFGVEELEYDPDPLVFNHYLVTNPSTVDQTFTVTTSLATTWSAPFVMNGSVTTSLSDNGGDGASVSAVPGLSIYSALIDGSTVQTLQGDPFSLSATAPFVANDTQSFANVAWGADVNSSIGITLQFTLSPGDTATILSEFEVIPEPATGGLVLLGGALLAAWRRQRN